MLFYQCSNIYFNSMKKDLSNCLECLKMICYLTPKIMSTLSLEELQGGHITTWQLSWRIYSQVIYFNYMCQPPLQVGVEQGMSFGWWNVNKSGTCLIQASFHPLCVILTFLPHLLLKGEAFRYLKENRATRWKKPGSLKDIAPAY